jgi:predicted nucleic acid-binding protein
MRGNEKARETIYERIPFDISVVTYMEIVQGMRNKEELKILLKYLKKRGVRIIQTDEQISIRAMFLVEDYSLSHSMELADALIAGTVLENQEELLTGNGERYRYIPNLQIEEFRP